MGYVILFRQIWRRGSFDSRRGGNLPRRPAEWTALKSERAPRTLDALQPNHERLRLPTGRLSRDHPRPGRRIGTGADHPSPAQPVDSSEPVDFPMVGRKVSNGWKKSPSSVSTPGPHSARSTRPTDRNTRRSRAVRQGQEIEPIYRPTETLLPYSDRRGSPLLPCNAKG